MDKIEKAFTEIRKFCQSKADPAVVKKYSRYFTEGYDAYGLDQESMESKRDEWLKKWEEVFSLDDYLDLGDKLIATGKYEEASFALAFVASRKDQFTADIFKRLGDWLENHIVNWAHTDILSGRILSHIIAHEIVTMENFQEWTQSGSKWKRRSVPVTLIDILKTDISLDRLFDVIEPLMSDSDKFVQKGLGWFLRESWKIEPDKTEEHLLKWKDTCGRIIIQYATEKMSKEYRTRFRRSKNES